MPFGGDPWERLRLGAVAHAPPHPVSCSRVRPPLQASERERETSLRGRGRAAAGAAQERPSRLQVPAAAAKVGEERAVGAGGRLRANPHLPQRHLQGAAGRLPAVVLQHQRGALPRGALGWVPASFLAGCGFFGGAGGRVVSYGYLQKVAFQSRLKLGLGKWGGEGGRPRNAVRRGRQGQSCPRALPVATPLPSRNINSYFFWGGGAEINKKINQKMAPLSRLTSKRLGNFTRRNRSALMGLASAFLAPGDVCVPRRNRWQKRRAVIRPAAG